MIANKRQLASLETSYFPKEIRHEKCKQESKAFLSRSAPLLTPTNQAPW